MNTMSTKSPNTKPIMTALVISWIIIILWVRWVFFKWNDASVDTNTQEVGEEETQKWYIWENVLLEWTLVAKEWFWMYTHTFTSLSGEEFGAKSSIVDLFSQSWWVELKWSIVEFKKDLPIIGVTEIVWSKKSNNTVEPAWTTLEGNPSLFYDLDSWLAIDLSISEWYDIEKSDGALKVIDRDANNEEVLFIDPFTCKQWDPLQDCVVLKDRFVTFNNDSFTNAQGVTFYNLTETNTWFAFNGEKQWYSLSSSQPNNITTFGSLIDFISENELDQFIIQNKNLCKNINSELAVVSRVTYTDSGNGLYDTVITWRNESEIDVTCTWVMKIGSPLKFEALEYDDWTTEPVEEAEQPEVEPEVEIAEDEIEEETAEPEAEEVVEEVIVDPVEKEVIIPESDKTIRPASFNGWLQYSSIRGFVMWFSKQGVSYGWSVLASAENLWQSWVSCIYKVNVTTWKNAETVSTNPDIVVYECTWIDSNNLPECQ